MPGTFAGKKLADGHLPTTWTAIYTVPASTVAFVKSMPIYNHNAAVQTVDVALNTSGTRRRVGRFELAHHESAEVVVPGSQWILEAGDTIEAQTTTATAVDYTVMGVEET